MQNKRWIAIAVIIGMIIFFAITLIETLGDLDKDMPAVIEAHPKIEPK